MSDHSSLDELPNDVGGEDHKPDRPVGKEVVLVERDLAGRGGGEDVDK
jgi:hypothetical protein